MDFQEELEIKKYEESGVEEQKKFPVKPILLGYNKMHEGSRCLIWSKDLTACALQDPVEIRTFSAHMCKETSRLVLEGHDPQDDISTMVFSRDGNKLAVGLEKNGIIKVYDLLSGKECCNQNEPKGKNFDSAGIQSLFFNMRADLLISQRAGADSISFWDATHLKKLGKYVSDRSTSNSANNIALNSSLTSDVIQLAICCVNHKKNEHQAKYTHDVIVMLDFSKGKTEERLVINPDMFIRKIEYSPDGHILVLANGEVLKLWDIEKNSILRAIDMPNSGSVRSMSLCDDGNLLALFYDVRHDHSVSSKSVMLFDLSEGVKKIQQLSQEYASCITWLRSLFFTPEGNLVLRGEDKNLVEITEVWKVAL
jgi:WD40 repeat protein